MQFLRQGHALAGSAHARKLISLCWVMKQIRNEVTGVSIRLNNQFKFEKLHEETISAALVRALLRAMRHARVSERLR